MDVTIYCCGGAALNIGPMFENQAITNKPKVKVVYLDLGRSNLKEQHDPDRTFIIPCEEDDKNGSGQHRAANVNSVVGNLDRILSTFEPSQFNVVLSSTSGGSGALINHLITDRLMKDGHVVIPMLIGTFESETSARNTIKALNGFYKLPQSNSRPLPLYYASNSDSTYSKEVDEDIVKTLWVLCEAITIEPHGLDNADVENFFMWNRTVESPNELALLETYIDTDTYNETQCLASLRFSKDAKEIDQSALYKVVQPLDEEYNLDSLDITISNENLEILFKDADSRLEKILTDKRKRSASLKREVAAGDSNLGGLEL